jgi:hypothetical protein
MTTPKGPMNPTYTVTLRVKPTRLDPEIVFDLALAALEVEHGIEILAVEVEPPPTTQKTAQDAR